MRAQHLALALFVGGEEEGVVHLAGRMALGEVERREIEVVGLDVRPLGHGEAHIGEDRRQLLDHLADRVEPAAGLGRLGHGQRHVDALGCEPRFEGCFRERVLLGRDRALHLVAQAVDERAALFPLLRRHGAEGLQEVGDGALLAERRDAHGFQGRFVAGGIDLGEQVTFELIEIGHRSLARCKRFE